MLSAPRWWRRNTVRTLIFSTTPLSLPTSMYSPSRNASSIRKNAPETMSRTSVCEPKPIATPTTLAPASSGRMSTPSAARKDIVAITTIVIRISMRKSGSSVFMREAGTSGPCSPSAASLRSIAVFASSHSR